MTFSLICPTNDMEKCNRWLLPSLARQLFRDFETILVDTVKKKYGSAAEALNAGADGANGDYLVFLHNDVEFTDDKDLGSLFEALQGKDFLVAGAAGCRAVFGKPWRKNTITNLRHGEKQEYPGNSTRLDSVLPCETLDECLFVVPRTVWKSRHLPVFYPSWHLYAVEYALWANAHRKNSVLAVPMNLWHHSAGGSFNRSYYAALWELAKLYRKNYSVMHTPIAAWPTNTLLLNVRIALEKIIRKLKDMSK